MNKIRAYIFAHKIISTIAGIVIVGGGYIGYKKFTSTSGVTRYITANVEKATIVSSISGSGQVLASDQVDIKAKASGNVTYLGVKNGSRVGSGTLIAELDTADTEKSIRDAELNLQSAQISLNKLKIQNSADNINADLAKAYDDGFNTVSNVFIDLPSVMTGLNDMFFKTNQSTGQSYVDWYKGQAAEPDMIEAQTYKQKFIDSYNAAYTAYGDSTNSYKTITRTSDDQSIENIIEQTYETVKLISDALKNANNYIDFVNDSKVKYNLDVPTIITTHKTTLSTYGTKINSALSNLLDTKTSIKNGKDALPNADLDLQSSELSVTERENALQDLKDKLADYYVRSPFAGTITIVNFKKGDAVGSGAAVATVVTNKQIAEISLNEVDIAKINIGQKATLTFDAIDGLNITGSVAEIDSVGTVSQGVVSYKVKITFDVGDARIKPGMTVNTNIQTAVHTDVLSVPSSAVKTVNGTSVVQVFDPAIVVTEGTQGTESLVAPTPVQVTTGISDDSRVEILSGLTEGEQVVSRTITGTTTISTTTARPATTGAARGGAGGFGGAAGGLRL